MECSWNDKGETKYYIVIFDQLQGYSGGVIWALLGDHSKAITPQAR